MRKTLTFIGLSLLAYSCAPQATAKKSTTPPPPVKKEEVKVAPTPKPVAKEKPDSRMNDGENEFYRVNIADASKNDNTISYGSLVSAKPKGYEVSRTYFPALGQNFRQRYIILHYTALDSDRSINVLTTQSVSAHYLIDDKNDKEIYQLVDENKRAYHSGISHWRDVENLNDASIGIEIVNTGYTADAAGNRTFYPYPEWQFRKIGALVKDLVDRYMIPPTQVLGHSDVAPTRKQDPGPLFPWERLYKEYGVGMWYDQPTVDAYLMQLPQEQFVGMLADPTFIFKYQTALKQFGYGIVRSGMNDDATQRTVQAFQYRFNPKNTSGVMDAETWAILQALLDKYPGK